MSGNGENLPVRGTSQRRDFSGTELVRSAETAVSAAAAQARAQVEAMYVMALQRPRDWMQVREKLLNECERRGLAESARYKLPWLKDPKTGKPVEGPSIRLAEAVIRSTPNLLGRTAITFEDEQRRVGTVMVVDAETNTSLFEDFSIEKTREVSRLRGGEEVLGERKNSNGQTVYKIVAEEAQVLQKQNSVVSRILRNLVFRVFPGDMLDEALAQCDATLQRGDAADPAGTAKKIADSFYEIGISTAQLAEYLGHGVDRVTPDEAKDLRSVFAAMKDEGAKWGDIIAAKREEKKDAAPPDPAETSEKAALVKRISEARLRDPKAWEKARKDAGVKGGAPDNTLPVETLRRMAGLLTGGGGSAPAEGGEDDGMPQEQLPDVPFGDDPGKGE